MAAFGLFGLTHQAGSIYLRTNGRAALCQETLEIERSQMTEEEEAEREELCSASKTRLRIMEKHLQRLEEQVSPRTVTLYKYGFSCKGALGLSQCARDVA